MIHHCMGLAIYDFLEELQAKLQPGSTFEVSEAIYALSATGHSLCMDSLEKILIKMHAKTPGNGIAGRRGGLGPAVGPTMLIYTTREL